LVHVRQVTRASQGGPSSSNTMGGTVDNTA